MMKDQTLLASMFFVGSFLVAPLFVLQAQEKGTLTVVLAGDANLHRKLSIYDDPAYQTLFKRVRTADASFINFETLAHPVNLAGGPYSGGVYSLAPGWISDEFKWAGFNLLSVANNHQFDYGDAGLRSSLKTLDAAGLVHAGAGENLAFALAPAYLDTAHGRVALVAVSSTLTPGSWASEQRPDLPGRFGIAPLRYVATYTVDQATYDGIRTIAQQSKGSQFEDGVYGIGHGRGDGYAASGQQDLRFGDAFYRVGAQRVVHTKADSDDLAGYVASVSNAHRQADLVIAAIHAHQSQPETRDLPPDFIVETAHAAIDAGADIFAVHGPHILKGIEIYKGKPIFYSLGNFAFDGDTQPFLPSESYDGLHLGPAANIADVFDVITQKETGGLLKDKDFFESFIVELTFDSSRNLTKIVLDPITLGQHEQRAQRGRPRPASPEDAKEILERVQRLSASYGTKVAIEDGRGVIRFR
jgi:poly-gamma-glutamate synthesis protein (capsule biosynthesis protein)